MAAKKLSHDTFLAHKANRAELHHFIWAEPDNYGGAISTERAKNLACYLSILKKEVALFASSPDDFSKLATCQFYLGELYARCPYTYKYLIKDEIKDENQFFLTTLKSALVYYINAMIYAGNEKIAHKHEAQLRDEIFKLTIVTLTELLNQNVLLNAAIDDLYARAKITLEQYVFLGKKKFLRFWKTDAELQRMLIKYENTIFEKMSLDVSKFRKKAKKKLIKKHK